MNGSIKCLNREPPWATGIVASTMRARDEIDVACISPGTSILSGKKTQIVHRKSKVKINNTMHIISGAGHNCIGFRLEVESLPQGQELQAGTPTTVSDAFLLVYILPFPQQVLRSGFLFVYSCLQMRNHHVIAKIHTAKILGFP